MYIHQTHAFFPLVPFFVDNYHLRTIITTAIDFESPLGKKLSIQTYIYTFGNNNRSTNSQIIQDFLGNPTNIREARLYLPHRYKSTSENRGLNTEVFDEQDLLNQLSGTSSN